MTGSLTQPKLVIYDLDETLVSAVEGNTHTFNGEPVGSYYPQIHCTICPRPLLQEHLSEVARHFTLAVWSAGREDYVDFVVRHFVFPYAKSLRFFWARGRCVLRRNFELDKWAYTKPLTKVRRSLREFAKDQMILVENDPAQVRDYGNAIYVPDFVGDPKDTVLGDLTQYLLSLRDRPSVRTIDKRGWQTTVRNRQA